MTVKVRPEALLTLFFLLVFLAAIAIGWEWPFIAKLMPVYVVAIPGVVLASVELYRLLTAWEERKGKAARGIEMDEAFMGGLERRTEITRTLSFFAWFIGGALAVWLLGIVVGLPLLVFLYTLVEGREKWSVCLLMSACAFAFLWGLFDYLLEMRWPPGLLWG